VPADEGAPIEDRGGAVSARPFLKWAGGKTQLLEALLARTPRAIDTYYEPFVGGGAMFFALLTQPDLAPRRAVLNDLNEDLVTVYRVVQGQPDALIDALAMLAEAYLDADGEARAAFYYEQRGRRPTGKVDLAARFIFLNKTCFNGLYRVNRRGEFNVPHGRYQSPRILDESGLREASRALREVELTSCDFGETLAQPAAGDFVYLDPPFEPLSKTSSFTGYTRGAFGRAEQQRLKWSVDDLTERGVHVMLSNSPQDYILGLYSADRGPLDGQRYRIESTPARRAINSRGDGRGAIDELIVLNYASEVERGRLDSTRA
jgi:DNA adenine methylase